MSDTILPLTDLAYARNLEVAAKAIFDSAKGDIDEYAIARNVLAALGIAKECGHPMFGTSCAFPLGHQGEHEFGCECGVKRKGQSKDGMARTDACGFRDKRGFCGLPRSHEYHQEIPSEAYDAPEAEDGIVAEALLHHDFVGEPIVQANGRIEITDAMVNRAMTAYGFNGNSRQTVRQVLDTALNG